MSAAVTTHEIAESLRVRIQAVREELERFDALREELTRLESALADLEPERSERPPKSKSSAPTTRRARAARPAPTQSTAPRRARSSGKAAPRGQTRERIVEFIRSRGAATAGEVANALSLNRNSVATRLTQLTKAGELQKAERGYTVSASNGASQS
jgi:predicted ArsR family transcriptional regulator